MSYRSVSSGSQFTGPWHWGVLLFAHCLGILPAQGDTKEAFFERQVRPLLIESCYECHSGQATRLGGNLRLDSRAHILAGGDLGPAAVVGNPDQSLLIRAIEHLDDDLKMPKRSEALGTAQTRTLRKWISDGLVWPGGQPSIDTQQVVNRRGFDLVSRKARLSWIWDPPQASALPEVIRKEWPLAGLDHFVLAQLESNNLNPNEDAGDSVWLRRISQAITGLPPSLTLQERFSAKPKSLRHGFAVDQLLASPRFGERWARHWMDLVRYAESRGHESDYIIANAYHYRDYLIRAFNDDLPYDEFVTEHLAGDLIPNPRATANGQGNESILGTGWAFLGEEVHSPVDIRQDECDRIDNKVDVLSKTFLGLTVACARCHDHKFDAISQQDYYSLSGFFLSSNFQQVRFETQQANRQVAERLDALRSSYQSKYWKAFASTFSTEIESVGQPGGDLASHLPSNATEIVSFRDTGLKGARLIGPALRFLPRGTWFISGADSQRTQIASRPAVQRDPAWTGLSLKPSNQKDAGSLDATSRSNGMLKTKRFRLQSGRIRYLIRGSVKVYAAVDSHLMVAGPLHGALVKTFKPDSDVSQRWVTHDLSEYSGHLVHLEFGTLGDDPLAIYQIIEEGVPSEKDEQGTVLPTPVDTPDDFGGTLAALKKNGFSFSRLASGQQRSALALARSQLAESETLQRALQPVSLALYQQEQLELAHASMSSLTAVALSDNNGVDESILIRGSPKRPGNLAPRRLLSAFESTEVFGRESSGRLKLAQSIASPSNPLTGRVIVNRVWHHLFGRGIVPTVDNFGYLGERPSHPELLDYLAIQFVNNDAWSLKRLIRRIVLSRTYRMSSVQHELAAAEKDPKNVLLSRFPIRRLEAEAIRDNVLAVSGSLNSSMYGTSIPVHLTDFVVGRGRPGESGPLDGHGRRSVYVAVRRNFLPTLMTAFDYPTPFSTIGKRNITNVPAQSLALMNDTFVHAQAKIWAQRLLDRPDLSDQERIKLAFQEAFCRLPSEAEREFCLEALSTFRSFVPGQGEPLKPWTDLCHSLLAMNELVYIR